MVDEVYACVVTEIETKFTTICMAVDHFAPALRSSKYISYLFTVVFPTFATEMKVKQSNRDPDRCSTLLSPFSTRA